MAVTADVVQVRLEAQVSKYLSDLRAAASQSDKTAATIARAAQSNAAAATRQAAAQLAAMRATGTATQEEIAAATATLRKARASEQATRAEVGRINSLRAEAAALAGVRNQTVATTSAFQRFRESAARTEASVVGSLKGVVAAYAGLAAVQGSVRLIDAATAIGNSLRVAGLEGAELTRVYDRLFESAQRNAAPLQSLAQLYGRVAIVQSELGVSTDELLGLTDNVAKALRVAGTDAQSASGALLQLSQALGSGVVRAEEFNSILEGALPIAQAAAAGLDEAGGSVARLRQLVVEGKVSSEAFFRAFEAGSYVLDERLAGAEQTVSQAFIRLQNVLIDLAGEMNEGSRISGVLSDNIDNLGEIIVSVAAFANAAVGPISEFIATLNGGIGAAQGFANELARISGLDQVGFNIARGTNDLGIPGLTAGSSAAGRTLDATFSLLGNTPQDDALAALLTGQETAASRGAGVVSQTFELLGNTPQDEALAALLTDKATGFDGTKPTVSLADYDAPSGAGGTGGKGAASAVERERQAVVDKIEAMEFERSLIGETAREQAILNAARDAGSAATAEQIERIRELAAATYDEQEAFDRLNMSAQEWADTVESATRSFIDDLIEGKDAAEAFSNVLSNIANKLLDVGLDNLFGGSGFNLTGLFGGTPTRATGGPVYAGTPTLIGEKGPELFIPSTPGRVVPNSQLGGGSVTFAPVIDARGADVAAVARLERVVQDMAANVVPTIRREIAQGPKKGRR